MAFTQIAVTGSYQTAEGEPVQWGNVRFIPTAPMHNATPPSETTSVTPVRAQVIDGEISVSLAATDDPGTTPTGVMYRVEERLGQNVPIVYYIQVPAGAGAIDLDTVTRYNETNAAGARINVLNSIATATDVDVSTAPEDGQVLAWNDTSDKWEPADVATSGALADLTDVDVTGAQMGQVVAVADDNPLGFGLSGAPTADGQLLAWDATGQQPIWVDTAEITPGDIGAQPADPDLSAIAALDSATAGAIASDGAGWVKKTYAQLKTGLTLVKGDVGLGNVDNTADTAKPVSAATQTALNLKADKAAMWKSPPAGRYYVPLSAHAVASSSTLGNGTLRLLPWVVRNALNLDRIAAEVATIGEAGSKFRLGIYADDGGTYPGALLLDAGQISGDSATVQELNCSLTLQPGVYWIGGVVQAAATTQPAVRTVSAWMPDVPLSTNGAALPSGGSAAIGYAQTGVTGALPASFSTSVFAVSAGPRLILRAA